MFLPQNTNCCVHNIYTLYILCSLLCAAFTVPLFTNCCVLHVHLSIYFSFFSSLQGHHGQGSQPLRENQGIREITFDFSSQGKSQGILEQMQTSGEIDKNCVEIRESDLLDCFTRCQGASEKSPQPHRLHSTDGCVCVCVCVLCVCV